MNNKLYVAKVVSSTSVDGVGLRNSLYVSGCNLHCPECHNKEWWPIKAGKEMDIEEVYDELNQDDFNISILGGEPMMQYPQILQLCKLIKKRTKKTIWLWTGYEIPYIEIFFGEILKYVDVIVDGPFIAKQKDSSLRFRGSANQQIYKVEHIPHISISNITNLYI